MKTATLSRRGLLLGMAASLTLPLIARPGRVQAQAQQALDDAEALIAQAGLAAEVGFVAQDALTGEVLAIRNGDMPLPPASTLKLITALYALDRLGPVHRFTTRVWRDGDTLVLAGGGDPELDSKGLAELARLTVAAEQAAGRGAPLRFQVWGGALPHIPRISAVQAEHLPYNPTISGMILNFNRVHLGWRRTDKGHSLSLEARGAGQSPRAYTIGIGVADRSQPLFTYDDSGAREQWTIARGAMGKSGSRWLPVRRPELYAGDVFQTLCRAQGLVLPTPEVTGAPPQGQVIASLESRALSDILQGMLEYSNNLTAEVVGLSASGQPELRASARDMQNWLQAKGITGNYSFADHSGLSADSRVTARLLADTVTRLGAQQPLRAMLKHIALRDGKGREIDSPIRVDAKTGTLNFVSNLAGFAQDGGGRLLSFAILTVDEPRRSASLGQELPDGVLVWTRRSKALQQALIEDWTARFGARIAQLPDLPLPAGGQDLGFSDATRPVIRPATMNSGVFR